MSAAIIALLAALVNLILDNIKNKRTIEYLESQSKVNQLMRKCIAETTIDRFLVLKLTNGANKLLEDGIPRKYRVSVINEEHKDIHTSVRDLYQLLFVDDFYQEVVKKSYNLKYYDFITESEKDCDLKTIYIKEGIAQARVYYIHTSNKIIYFCSLSSYNKFNFSKQDEDLISITISKITESYITYYK